MDKKRKVILVVFIVVSVAGMWARYAHQKSERERMERMINDLARVQREQRMLSLYPTPTPTPADAFEETRDPYSGERSRESLEAIRQAVGQDFKLMELRFADERTTALVSTDGKGVEQYVLQRGRKVAEGPSPVNLVGDNPLADSLYEQKAIDLDLLQKLAQDALTRSGIEGARVTSAKLAYEYIRYKGESPVWTFMVERGTPPDWAHKFVTYDAKGKFKTTF
ncbi:MAG TPA: hypothetical protein VF297_19180 [Pyrinomonadaceae bacterium]